MTDKELALYFARALDFCFEGEECVDEVPIDVIVDEARAYWKANK